MFGVSSIQDGHSMVDYKYKTTKMAPVSLRQKINFDFFYNYFEH